MGEPEFNDDPSFFALERGTLAFAKAGQPNTRSTQVFINYRENNRLADPSPHLSFWVFGKVVQGMDVVDKFVQVGDPSGGSIKAGSGPTAARIWSRCP